ncbi:MAG: PTS sugar transporter subunit IIA [Rhodospirillaceae bacterium]|nr:PTS fructose transporter subunit IIA [Rhodospirillaceae bacterium]RPG03344.1 MAG: PTS sugar transporter subunit IIA [Rhodospirillaceae bacterium TMED63]RZO35916.1 MAG: PTS sugar transporter subunit IIA [Rhodospirillaceae bacterium]
MIGLVIVTHGRLADEFVAALEHVVGPQKMIETICIGPDERMDNRRQDILDAVARADTGTGVIVLTDMFGGTPSNLAISILKEAKIEVIAGVNLPLLVKLAGVRKTADLETAVKEAYAAGRKYIKLASELLDDPRG